MAAAVQHALADRATRSSLIYPQPRVQETAGGTAPPGRRSNCPQRTRGGVSVTNDREEQISNMPFGVIALWGLRLVLATALSAVLLGAALYTDAWRVQESFAAPFAHEFGDETKALAVQLGKFLPFPRLFATDGDTPSQLHRSSLRILAGDCQLGPAHAEHEVVRKQGGGAYSHWGNHLLFSLPDGIANSPGTQISVEYSISREPTLLRDRRHWGTRRDLSGEHRLRRARRLRSAKHRHLHARTLDGITCAP